MRFLCLLGVALLAACSAQSPREEAGSTPTLTASNIAPESPAATAAAAPAEEADEFKPPPGYKRKVENGNIFYCAKVTVLGSRFPKDDCRTQAQLEDLEMQKANARGELEQRRAICSQAAGCASP